ncbi:MAG TPA: transglycosylase SLT domain-containing protein, partial [Candidatus Baltobacteraceae bacterium]
MSIAADLDGVERRIAQLSAPLSAVTSEHDAGVEFSLAMQPSGSRVTAAVRGKIDELARREGARAGVDPALIEAIIANESAYDTHAVSSAGARGLMQLMPQTAASLGVGNPDDPTQNVAGGT